MTTEQTAQGDSGADMGIAVHEWVAHHAGVRPGSPAILTPSHRLTYGELETFVAAFSGELAGVGYGPGDRLLVSLPNSPAAVVASLAAQRLGGTAVEVDRLSPASALDSIMRRSGVRLAVVWGRDLAKWRDVPGADTLELIWVVIPDGTSGPSSTLLPGLHTRPMNPDGSVEPGPSQQPRPPEVEIDPDSAALVLFTSGSTGMPMGVIQTHRNIWANTVSIVSYLGLTHQDRVLATLPLHYCYGRSLLQTHMYVGGSVYFDDRFAFPRTVMEALGSMACTGFAGVPLTFEILRRRVDLSTIEMPKLRYVTQAGGAMARDTIRWARKAFAPADLYVMYGQTEATARLTYLPPRDAITKEGSIGVPVPGVELRVVDTSGTEVTPGMVGEIVARGDNVTPGYLDDPEATAQAIRDGWLWTGDLAVLDEDGYLYHRGRAKEIIKVGGHRVSLAEIEQAMERHPDVEEAAVWGSPDDLMGEVPMAAVVIREGSDTNESSLREFARSQIPSHMVPVRFRFVRKLPRTSNGKLQRSVLAVELAADPTEATRQ